MECNPLLEADSHTRGQDVTRLSETENSEPFPQEAVTGPHRGAVERRTLPHYLFQIRTLRPTFPNRRFHVGFLIKIFCALIISTRATCPVRLKVNVFIQ